MESIFLDTGSQALSMFWCWARVNTPFSIDIKIDLIHLYDFRGFLLFPSKCLVIVAFKRL